MSVAANAASTAHAANAASPKALELPGVQNHPKTTRPRRMSFAERLYLPLLGGLMVTIRHMFQNLLRTRRRVTIQYPEERRQWSPRYRGHHILTTRPDGSVRCVACFLCATACPAECIHIEAGERPESRIEKYPTRFEIDLLRCVYCGFCVDACPEEAIIMSRENDLVGTTRAELIIDRDHLMDRAKVGEYGAGYRPVDHDARRPVRIAALERLKTEHGIVPGMPRREPPA